MPSTQSPSFFIAKPGLAIALFALIFTSIFASPRSHVLAMQGAPKPTELTLLPEFQAELIYTVPEKFGSWVSITNVPGGLVASDQYGKLYRITPARDESPTEVQPMDVNIGRAQGLLWAFDSLYVVAHAGGGLPAGLFRVTDSDGDGQLDDVKLLRKFEGGGEHGPHAVILGPDGNSLYVCAGNHTKLTDVHTSRVPQVWQEDQLLKRMWDPGGHAVGINAPGGWICKTDPDGKEFELVSMGYRNQYDIAFDGNGELFTFDADMEWDIGTPWYRPTRVCHATSGSEFGWRGGNGKWPIYYPDSVPPVVDVGPGSPTGVVFGTGSHFPDKYQRAFYVADWSYGFIYAVHMTADGGTYKGEAEVFCSAPALQVTDMIVDPENGDFYFAIGGRRTQSALYRISAKSPNTASAKPTPLNDTQKLRMELEQLHVSDDASVVDSAWPYLSHEDRSIRFAARTAIENQDPESWIPRVMESDQPQEILEGVTAIARTTNSHQADCVKRLNQLDWNQLNSTQRLHLLRNYGLVLMRTGDVSAEVIGSINEELSPQYPSDNVLENRELCRLLIATDAPDVISKTVELLHAAPTQEEQIHYVMCLRNSNQGWTPELREQYLTWFLKSAVFQGGKSFAGYLRNAREEFIRELDEKQKEILKPLIEQSMVEQDPYEELKARAVVKIWTVDDLLDMAEDKTTPRDLENGRKIFAIAQCFKCHRFEGAGGIVGPDLTGLSRRYNTKYLLEALVDPSKEVNDQYRATVFMLNDGRMVTGRVANLNNNVYMVQTDMIKPGVFTNIDRNDIDAMRSSRISMMPENLLDSFTAEEIMDLIAYLRSADVPQLQDK